MNSWSAAGRAGILAAALLISQTAPLFAQYVERVEVSIGNVDVVVTDRKGNPVTGLTKDDFEIFEDGKQVTITNFTAYALEKGEARRAAGAETPSLPAPKPQPKLVVMFVDIHDIDPYRSEQFFDGVRGFLRSTLREGDLVTVLTWKRRIHVLLEPTSDPRRIDVAIAGLSAPYRDRERRVARELSEMIGEQSRIEAELLGGLAIESDPEADAAFEQFIVDEQRCQATKRKAKELRTVLALFSRVELKKVLIFAGDDLSLTPASDCLTIGELDALADTANAYGMTIHAMHPPGAREHRGISARIGGMPSMDAPAPQASEYSRVWDEAGGLLLLAERTGGHIGVGAPQATKVLQQVAVEIESYYSLGYRMTPGRENETRSIRVVTKNPKHRVRARQSVVRLSESARLRDLVTTNLYLPPPASAQRPAFDAVTVGVTRDGRFLVVEVRLSIRARDLVAVPGADGKSRGSFSVFAAAGRELGDASDVVEATQEFDAFPEGDDPRIEYTFGARIRPDTRRLSIAVRDNLTGEVASTIVSFTPM